MTKAAWYKVVIAVSIELVLAIIHVFRIGSYLDQPLYDLYYSYFSDVVLPFGAYFLLCINETSIPILVDWRVKALAILAATTGAELGQAAGIPVLGVTFDPLDIAMYATGVTLAVVVDTRVFSRLFAFWVMEDS